MLVLTVDTSYVTSYVLLKPDNDYYIGFHLVKLVWFQFLSSYNLHLILTDESTLKAVNIQTVSNSCCLVLLFDCDMMKYRFSVSVVAQWVYEESGAWLPAAPTATSGSPAKYVCNECGKVFSRNDSFAHHKTIHKGQTRCPICQKLFSRKYTMMSHLLIIHGIKYSSR